MPTSVDIPGVGEVEFPDSMSTTDIEREATKLHIQANPPKSNALPSVDSSTADKILGELGNDSLSQQGAQNFDARKGEEGLGGGLNSFEGSIADQGKSNAMSATGAIVGAGLGGPAVAEALTTAAEAHPVIAKILEKGLEHVVGPGVGIAAASKLLKLFGK